jgi:hypothetical protein
LDGGFDYGLDATLSPELSAQIVLPESFLRSMPQAWRGQIDPAALLKDDEGRAQVFVMVGGNYREPRVTLDMERMVDLLSERFESRVVGHVSQAAEEKLKRGLEQLLGSRKP